MSARTDARDTRGGSLRTSCDDDSDPRAASADPLQY
jgi:hypothetical protein